MHFRYECNARGLDGKVDGNVLYARGLDGKVDGNVLFCEIVCGITRNAPDGKADGNFDYKTYYFSEASRC